MARSKIQISIIWFALTAILSVAVHFWLPLIPRGNDWIFCFATAEIIPAHYPPWTKLVLGCLTWDTLIGLTLSTYIVAVLRRARSVASAILAFLAMPLTWVVWLGQLDGLPFLGVLGLPWLVPLVLLKPQVAAFALLAKRKYLIAAVIFLLVSLAIWGLWPADLFTYRQEGREHWDIALRLWGLPLAALVMWLVPGWDTDKLMLAGACVTWHLMRAYRGRGRWRLSLPLGCQHSQNSGGLCGWQWYFWGRD